MEFFRRGQKFNGAVDGALVDSRFDETLRDNLKSRLSGSIKDLQIQYGDGNSGVPIDTNELTHALVTVIEAIFIQGLKGQPTRAVAAANLRHMPGPSFWTFVLVFTHKETISNLEKLNAITSDIGRGRAWIRLAINEGFLCSYMTAMTGDKKTLRRFYHRHSIFRDADTMDIFIRYLRGIEIYRFNIALNSGLLNRWATGPLILAGLCLSDNNALEPSPSTAVDAAAMLSKNNSLETEEEANTGPNSLNLPSTSTEAATEAFEIINKPAGYLNRGLLNEDEALKLILAGSPMNFSGSSSNADSPIPMPSSPVVKRNKESRVSRKSQLAVSQNPRQEKEAGVSLLDEPNPKQGQNQSFEESVITKIPEEPTTEAFLESDSLNTNEIRRPNKEETEAAISPIVNGGLEISPKQQEEVSRENDDISDSSEDDEDMIDIYARRHDSSCGETESIPENYITASEDVSAQQSLSMAPLEAAAASIVDDQMKKVTAFVSKRGCYGLSSSRSSGSESSLTLASVPYLSGFIDSFQPFGAGRFFDTPPKGDDESRLMQYGFSLQPHVQIGTLNEEDSQELMLIFDQVIREEGLDAQNYECAECTRAIGTIFGPAKICAYTRRYYCEECHLDEMSVIPAKIMYNWDFRQFKVCHKVKLFLTAVSIEPIINVKSFNGELFEFAPSLQEVFDLRRQLRYMNAYLSTCSNGKSKAKKTFDKMLWPRQYLYDDIDMYSVRDLEDINSGRLVASLTSTVKFSLGHILKCILCSGKGKVLCI